MSKNTYGPSYTEERQGGVETDALPWWGFQKGVSHLVTMDELSKRLEMDLGVNLVMAWTWSPVETPPRLRFTRRHLPGHSR